MNWAIFYDFHEIKQTRSDSKQGSINLLYKLHPHTAGRSIQSLAQEGYKVKKTKSKE